MVSAFFALLHATNTMKDTIDDADYIINWIALIFISQCVKKPGHSHSMVAGGLLEISYVTREMPLISLMMRLDTRSSNWCGR